MSVGKVINGVFKFIGGIGATAWAGLGVITLGYHIKDMWEEHNRKQWKAGFDSSRKEIEELRKENNRLLEEAFKRNQAAE